MFEYGKTNWAAIAIIQGKKVMMAQSRVIRVKTNKQTKKKWDRCDSQAVTVAGKSS